LECEGLGIGDCLSRPRNAKFDEDVVAWFKSQGRGYQTRMNAVLRHYMQTQKKVG
jgi:uncharacterized protein (DUF4415 family)